jgi:predicted dinucleotide-binding enzyme
LSYSIIGAGKVGQALARAFARNGVTEWGEVRMRILTLAVLIAGFATLIAVPAALQAQEPPKNIVITP